MFLNDLIDCGVATISLNSDNHSIKNSGNIWGICLSF